MTKICFFNNLITRNSETVLKFKISEYSQGQEKNGKNKPLAQRTLFITKVTCKDNEHMNTNEYSYLCRTPINSFEERKKITLSANYLHQDSPNLISFLHDFSFIAILYFLSLK